MALRIYDAHTHTWSPRLARRVATVMPESGPAKAYGFTMCLNGTTGDLLTSMDKAGIERSNLLYVPQMPDSVQPSNRSLYETVKTHEDRLSAFGAFHPGHRNWKDELLMCKEVYGFKGIKFHSIRQGFDPTGAFSGTRLQLFTVYKEIARLELMALFDTFHYPATFDPSNEGSFNFPPHTYTSPAKLKEILERFPELIIIAAHMFGLGRWDEVIGLKLWRYPNLYGDTSFAVDYMNKDQFETLARGFGKDRLLFGTDSPFKDQRKSIEKTKEWLPLEFHQAVFYDNAARLFLGEKKR